MCENNTIIKEFRENNISYYLIQTPYGICKQQKLPILKRKWERI